mgnify:CR=1 FL=1
MTMVRGLLATALLLLSVAAPGCAPAEPVEPTAPAVDTGPMTGVEKAYLEFVVSHLQTVNEDIALLEMLFSTPDFEDQYWQASVTTLLNRIEVVYQSLATLKPTERLQPFQDASVSALQHAASFVKLLRDMLAVDQTTLTEEAEQELIATGKAFGEADRLLTEFLEAHPVPDELKDNAS